MDDALEQIAKDVVDTSMKLHMALGPGLLESVYTVIHQRKLQQRGYQVEREVPIPVVYEGLRFELGFRADLIINGCFIVELKSVERLAPVHAKQTAHLPQSDRHTARLADQLWCSASERRDQANRELSGRLLSRTKPPRHEETSAPFVTQHDSFVAL